MVLVCNYGCMLALCCVSVLDLQNACDEYLRTATEQALAHRQMKESGKKKSKEELAKLAVMGFADRGQRRRKELPKYVRQSPAIGSDEVCEPHQPARVSSIPHHM